MYLFRASYFGATENDFSMGSVIPTFTITVSFNLIGKIQKLVWMFSGFRLTVQCWQRERHGFALHQIQMHDGRSAEDKTWQRQLQEADIGDGSWTVRRNHSSQLR